MKYSNIKTLVEISNALTKYSDNKLMKDCVLELLNNKFSIKNFNVYIYDNVSNTIRNFFMDWDIINQENSVCYFLTQNKNFDFVLNNQMYLLQNINEYFNETDNVIMLPIIKDNSVFGIIEFIFEEQTNFSYEILSLFKIFSVEISLKLQNIVLDEQAKINVEFYNSMKNIAKIIETQYELNYIVPLIGEMLDRFISDPLIYIFLKQNNKFNLIWQKACNDNNIYEAIKLIDSQNDFLLINNNKLGIFPLVSEKQELIGCVVARSITDKLSKHDVNYLEQLTKQASITINKANSYAKILQYATLDALTNLNNRRQFDSRLKEEIALSKRQKKPLCAMMIDIDFFKKVNDTYGHSSGDEVLKTVAKIIKEQIRESDIASRYGGEEFSVILPFTPLEEAQKVAERLRCAVEKNVVKTQIKDINVTISIGISEFNFTETGEDLFKRADNALYKAKESGRNKVCIA